MLTINSYSLLFKSEEDAVFGYRINIFLTLMLHFTLFAPVLLQNMHLYYLAFYLAQMAYLFLFPIIFRAIHRRSNRLLINLMMIMLSIGLPILTRLGRQKAVKQFVFLLIASAVVLVIPMLLKRFETTRKLAAVFGILGLALGCATGIIGLIFSIIGLSKANNYIATYGDIANQVRIGKRLSIAGIIVSIVMTILIITLIVLLVILAEKDPEGFKKVVKEISHSL